MLEFLIELRKSGKNIDDSLLRPLLLNNNKVDVNLPDKNNKTPLYVAVKNLNTEIVRILLENSKVDVKNRFGNIQ